MKFSIFWLGVSLKMFLMLVKDWCCVWP